MSVAMARLPLELRTKLDRLARRLRRTALLRGAACIALVAAVGAGLAMAADLSFGLSSPFRLALWVAWLAVIGVTAYLTVFRRLRRLRYAELAAVVESTHPELAERLTSTVELNEADDPEEFKGSQALIDALTIETLQQTHALRFERSLSMRRVAKVAAWAAVAWLLLAAPLFIWPEQYRLLAQRFASPWSDLPPATNLYLEVTPGNAVVAINSDLEIAAEPRWRSRAGEPPLQATLHRFDAEGNEIEAAMRLDDLGRYVATVADIAEGFTYYVSAPGAQSERFEVTAVEPPAVAALHVDIQPPAYTGWPAETRLLAGDLDDVFEGSRVTFVFEFNKPVVSAEIEWPEPVDAASPPRPARAAAAPDAAGGQREAPAEPEVAPEDEAEDAPEQPVLELFDGGRSGRVTVVANASGTYKIVLVDEHGLTNRDVEHAVIVRPDAPPHVVLAGAPEGREPLGTGASQQPARDALPADVLGLTVTAGDDVSVEALELRYTINGADPAETDEAVIVAIDFEAVQRAAGRDLWTVMHDLRLAPLNLSEGDMIRYRVRAADGRPVPGPNVSWAPPLSSPEYVLRIRSDADPLRAEELAREHEALRDELAAIHRDVQQSGDTADETRARLAPAAQQNADADHNLAAANLAERQGDAADRLQLLARRFEEHALMQPLAEAARQVAEQPLTEAEQAFREAAEAARAQDQLENVEHGRQRLAEAEERLAEMLDSFERLAELEQDLQRVGVAAERLEQLAERTEELAAQPDSPEAREELADIRREQAELAEELQRLFAENPELMAAAQEAQRNAFEELAALAEALAQPEDLLAQALAEEAARLQDQLQPLAEQQRELADQAEQLAQESAEGEPQEGEAAAGPADALREAAEALEQGDLGAAAEAQERALDELLEMAREMELALNLPADPREAAAELARRQRELNQRAAEAAEAARQGEAAGDPQGQREAPAEPSEQLEEALRPLAAEQAALHAAASRLDVPPAGRDEQQQAVAAAREALRDLTESDPDAFAESGDQAREAFEELAADIPTEEERLAQAREDVARLRREQEQIAQQSDAALAEAAGEAREQRLQELAQQQTDVARQLADLDAPGAEPEQRRAVRESAQALADLMGRAEDVPASQQDAQLALERLEQQLAGEPSAARQAAELARRQEELNERAAEAAAHDDPQALADAAREQAEVAEQAAQLNAPDAAPEQHDAARAARQAAAERARAAANPEDQAAAAAAQQAGQQAAETLRELADALADDADPAERARQLAARQAQAAEQAQQAGESGEPPQGSRQDMAEQAELLAEQTERLRTGDASEQRAEAADALRNAAEAARNAEPQQVAEAQQQAAEALQRLADELGQSQPEQVAGDPGEQDPAQAAETARQIARQQRELADASEQAAQAAAENPDAQAAQEQLQQAAEQIGRQQHDLNAQAAELPSEHAPVEAAQAQSAGRRAEQALQQGDAERAAAEQREAAEALEQLAEALEQSAAEQTAGQQGAASQPTPEQVEQAEALAQQQQALNEALAQAAQAQGQQGQPGQPSQGQQGQQGQQREHGESPLSELLAEQAEIAREAGELSEQVASAEGEQSPASQQAAQAAGQTNQTQQQAQAGNLQQAAESGRQAAEGLGRLSEQLAEGDGPLDEEGRSPSQEAEELAGRQGEVAEQLEQLAQSMARSQAQSEAQQLLQQQASELAQQLASLAARAPFT